MKQYVYEAIALSSITISIVLGVSTISSGDWISACVPLSTVLMRSSTVEAIDGGFQSIYLTDQTKSSKEVKVMEKEQIPQAFDGLKKEKIVLTDTEQEASVHRELEKSSICASKGFFKHCIYGDSFLKLNSFSLCITHAVGMGSLSSHERRCLSCIITSLVLALVVFVFSLIRWSECVQSFLPFVRFLNVILPLITFISGLIMFLGLLSIIIKSMEYSDDKTSFYNEMLERVFKGYLDVGLVDWRRSEYIPEAEVWAREVIEHMSYFGLGRSFYITLVSALLILLSCACLIHRQTNFSSTIDARMNGKHC